MASIDDADEDRWRNKRSHYMSLKLSTGIDGLANLVTLQLSNNFGLNDGSDREKLTEAIDFAVARVETCFDRIANKYYSDADGCTTFDPFHSCQYTTFLYYLSRRLGEQHPGDQLAAKVYYLNKMLNGCDLFHAIELPDVFFMEHPVASVMGRAKYSNYFAFQQGCTVGGNRDEFGILHYPVLGEYVWMFANATVIGRSRIGDNVFFAAGAFVKDAHVPDNTIVFGQSPNLVLKTLPTEFFHARSPFRDHHDRLSRPGAA
jgi:serine O-acetyltransferase